MSLLAALLKIAQLERENAALRARLAKLEDL